MSERSRGALLAGGALVFLGFVWASLDARVREQGSGASPSAEVSSSTTHDPSRELGAEPVDPERPDPHAGVDFDEPPPGPEIDDAESEHEAALGAGEKAEQSRPMQGAHNTRAAALRERADAARADGDHEEAARLEQILSRLELPADPADPAEELDAQAVGEPGAPPPDDAHSHDHASE